MNIFDKVRSLISGPGNDDNVLYGAVAEELESGVLDKAIWTRALAETDYDQAKAKARYIQHRVKSLRNQLETFAPELKKRLENDARVSALLDKGCTIEAIEYLGNPIHVSAYMTKYRLQRNAIDKAISTKKVKGFLIDGALWLEDKKI